MILFYLGNYGDISSFQSSLIKIAGHNEPAFEYVPKYECHQDKIKTLESTFVQLDNIHWSRVKLPVLSRALAEFCTVVCDCVEEGAESNYSQRAMHYLGRFEERVENCAELPEERVKLLKGARSGMRAFIAYRSFTESFRLRTAIPFEDFQLNLQDIDNSKVFGVTFLNTPVLLRDLKVYSEQVLSVLSQDLPKAVHVRIAKDLRTTLQDYSLGYKESFEDYKKIIATELEEIRLFKKKSGHSEHDCASAYERALRQSCSEGADTIANCVREMMNLSAQLKTIVGFDSEYRWSDSLHKNLIGSLQNLQSYLRKQASSRELLVDKNESKDVAKFLARKKQWCQEQHGVDYVSKRKRALVKQYRPDSDFENEPVSWLTKVRKAANFALCSWLSLDGLSVAQRVYGAVQLGNTEEFRAFSANCNRAQAQQLGDQVELLNEEADYLIKFFKRTWSGYLASEFQVRASLKGS